MPYATLPERSLLRISGGDSLTFLQGLVSNDVLRLHDAGIVYAALLTPQGKFLYDFFLLSQGGGVLLDCARESRAALLQLLTRYRLRSKVTIEPMADSFAVTALWNEEKPVAVPDELLSFPDPRLAGLGWRVVGDAVKVQEWCRQHAIAPAAPEDYDRQRIALGVPEGGKDLIPDKSFLLHFGFEYLHGVDFRKGCYIGQEVTARGKHLGQARKMIYSVTSREGALPGPGTPVFCGEMTIGELRSAREAIGLALLQVEEVKKAHEMKREFHCGGRVLEVQLADWIKKAV